MKKILLLTIVLFVFTITMKFFDVVVNESIVSYNRSIYTMFYKDYTNITLYSSESYESIDYDELVNNFDVSIETMESNETSIISTVYVSNAEVKDGLFGQTSPCEIPFNNQDNECGYIYPLNNIVVGYDSLDNFNANLEDVFSVAIIVNNESANELTLYLQSNYGVKEGTYSKYNYIGEMNVRGPQTRFESTMIIVACMVLISLSVIFMITSQIENFRLQSINGNSAIRIYFTNIFKQITISIIFLFVLLGVVLLFIGLNYSMWLAKYYLIKNFAKVILLILVMVISSLISFSFCFFSNTYELLNNRVVIKKVGVFSVLLTLLIVVVLSINLPVSVLKNRLVDYKDYQAHLEQVVKNNYRSYIIDSDYQDVNMEEYLEVISNNHYMIDDNLNRVSYVSTSFARIQGTSFKFDDKKNYYYGGTCDSATLPTQLEFEPQIAKDDYRSALQKNYYDEICLVITNDLEAMQTRYQEIYQSTTIISDSLDSEMFVQFQKYRIGDPYYIVTFYQDFLTYFIWFLVAIISNALIFVSYLKYYYDYEYYRYIFARSYQFLFRYIIVKTVVNLFLLLLLFTKQSIEYALVMIVFDLLMYVYYTLNIKHHR